MIRFTKGNLLEAETDAIVNTVNTVGVMGKGIALQFRDAYPANYQAYLKACKLGEVQIGKMFVFSNALLGNPKWIINFPTKKHWRHPTKIEWIIEGLEDLRQLIERENISSISMPPIGCGNGGLQWGRVRDAIVVELSELENVDVVVYEPTDAYQSPSKRSGVEKLTLARAMVAEMVRRYMVLGFDCSILEVQKLAWFLDRATCFYGLENPFKFQFEANRFGPYSDRLRHLLDAMDGSYLHSERRLSDAKPHDAIWFDSNRRNSIEEYLNQEAFEVYRKAIDWTTRLINGFESPLGMELLATVDWLLAKENCQATIEGTRAGLMKWPGGGPQARERKLQIFDDRLIGLALDRLIKINGADEPRKPRRPGSAKGKLTIIEEDDEHLIDFEEYMG